MTAVYAVWLTVPLYDTSGFV